MIDEMAKLQNMADEAFADHVSLLDNALLAGIRVAPYPHLKGTQTLMFVSQEAFDALAKLKSSTDD